MARQHTDSTPREMDWEAVNRRIAQRLRFDNRTVELLSFLPLTYSGKPDSDDDGYVPVADLTEDMGLKNKAQVWKYLRQAEEHYGLRFEVRHKNTSRAEIRLPRRFAERVRGLLTRSLTQSANAGLSECVDVTQ